jgi:catechol 2,3-dioxygenase-like lactoylglutathione lyase family enzyme
VITGFHRITLAARDPAAGAQAFADFLGRPFEPSHDGVESLTLANLQLQLRRKDPEEAEGIARITFAVDDLGEARRMLERRGAPTRMDGEVAVLEAAASHGVELALAEADGDAGPRAQADAIEGLDHVVIRTPDADRAIALYGARMGLDFRLDRSNPAWGSRLLFFRCGDAVVEFSVEADPASPAGPDKAGGLAWRARDPAAVHARVSAQGLDVSALRSGRKPGTHVFTLRSGVVAAPALIIGSEARE